MITRDTYPQTVGHTAEQSEAILWVTQHLEIGYSQMLDQVLACCFPQAFDMPWPEHERQPRAGLYFDKRPNQRGGLYIYAVLLSAAQYETVNRIKERFGVGRGVWAAIVEECCTACFETLYNVPWPRYDGRMVTLLAVPSA